MATVITPNTPDTTWQAKANVPARRKTRYSAAQDRMVVDSELPAFTGDFELTIKWNQLLHSLGEKAARSSGKKAKALSGAITLKFKGPAK